MLLVSGARDKKTKTIIYWNATTIRYYNIIIYYSSVLRGHWNGYCLLLLFSKTCTKGKGSVPKNRNVNVLLFRRGFVYRPTRALWLPIRRQTNVEGSASGTTATAARRRFSARRSSVDRSLFVVSVRLKSRKPLLTVTVELLVFTMSLPL